MNTLEVIALIVVALVILAAIIAYRKRLAVILKVFGINLTIEAENEATQQATPSQPAGVRVAEAKSTAGGLLIEEGRSETGTGIDVTGVEVQDDIIIGKGESGSPKADPPT